MDKHPEKEMVLVSVKNLSGTLMVWNRDHKQTKRISCFWLGGTGALSGSGVGETKYVQVKQHKGWTK